jgi:hypothetical protein
MKPERFTEMCRMRQRGDALLEALIGILLLGAVGLGLSYASARVMVSQRNLNAQNAVLMQMGNSLAGTGLSTLCSATTGPIVSVAGTNLTLAPLTCTKGTVTVSGSGGGLDATLSTGVVTAMTMPTVSSCANSTSTSSSDSLAAAKSLVGGDGCLSVSTP